MVDCYDRFWHLLVAILLILESLVSALREIQGGSQRMEAIDNITDF